jgi:thiamine transport system substrate-binding protein
MNTKPNRIAALTITLVLLAMGLSGCMGLFTDPETCPDPQKTPASGAKPFAGWELKVLTHGAWSWTYDAIKDQFENETGARLTEIAAADAGTALQEAVLNRGRPVADVIWGIDNALFQKARNADILQSYTSPNTNRILKSIDLEQFKDAGGQLLATPADHGYIGVNYDIRLANGTGANAPPQTLRDLATPRWAPQFVTQDPRTSSPGLGFLIATVATFGEDGSYTWRDYWAELLANGALVTSDWTTAYSYHYSANGFGTEGAPLDRTIVTSYTTSPAAEVYYGSFETPNAVSLEPPLGVFHQVETVAILKCTTQTALAERFIDYVLTPEFQRTIPDTQAIYPIIEGVAMPDAYQQYATDPADLTPATFSTAKLGASVDTWVRHWRTIFEAHTA